MRSVRSVVVAGAVMLSSAAAFAADVPAMAPPPPPYGYAPPPPPAYPPPPPPAYAPPPPPQAYAPPPVADEFVGWYLRGDIGVSQQKVKSLHNVLYETPGTNVNTVFANFDGATLFGAGVGYQFGSWFRVDVTGEYRAKTSFHGLDIVMFPGGIQTDEYRASKSEILALVNLYADLGTWWCVTPFIGVGVGGVKTTISNFIDINTPAAGVAYGKDTSKFSFAYALHAGLGYKVSNNLTLEFAYRYVDLGNALSGDLRTYTGVNNVNNPMHFNSLSSHDFKIGMRWTCCDPTPAPVPVAPVMPVLMRRG